MLLNRVFYFNIKQKNFNNLNLLEIKDNKYVHL